MIPDPKSPYAINKFTDEHYCRIFRIFKTSLRTLKRFGTKIEETII